jgi:hypothetical protein
MVFFVAKKKKNKVISRFAAPTINLRSTHALLF